MLRKHALTCTALLLWFLTPGTARAQDPATQEKALDNQPSSYAGLQNLKLSGLMQVWYLASDASDADTFRLRRAELKLTGDVTPHAKFTVMIDPSRALAVNTKHTTIDGNRVVEDVSVNQAGRVLQDAFISLTYVPGIELHIGQFKVPLGLEGLSSSATLGTVERALFSSDRLRDGYYADVRELGVMAQGSVSALDYQVGVFNGLGLNQNSVDKDTRKSIAGRVVWRLAFLAGVQLGVSGATDRHAAEEIDRRRLGFEWQWTYGPWTWRAELMSGRDAALRRRGYYVQVGYHIASSLEVISRVDTWDPDTNFDTGPANTAECDYIAGLNYLVAGHNVKVQVAYLRKTFAGDAVAARNVFLTNMQLSW